MRNPILEEKSRTHTLSTSGPEFSRDQRGVGDGTYRLATSWLRNPGDRRDSASARHELPILTVSLHAPEIDTCIWAARLSALGEEERDSVGHPGEVDRHPSVGRGNGDLASRPSTLKTRSVRIRSSSTVMYAMASPVGDQAGSMTCSPPSSRSNTVDCARRPAHDQIIPLRNDTSNLIALGGPVDRSRRFRPPIPASPEQRVALRIGKQSGRLSRGSGLHTAVRRLPCFQPGPPPGGSWTGLDSEERGRAWYLVETLASPELVTDQSYCRWQERLSKRFLGR